MTENIKKIQLNDLMQSISKEFKNKKDERWEEVNKGLFLIYISCLQPEKFEEFLEERGWNMEDLEEEFFTYIKHLFPDNDLF